MGGKNSVKKEADKRGNRRLRNQTVPLLRGHSKGHAKKSFCLMKGRNITEKLEKSYINGMEQAWHEGAEVINY